MEQTKVMNLPILRHFENSEIASSVNSFRKGEKSWYDILKLAIFGGFAFLTWVYILPPLFMALGKLAAVAGTMIGIVALVILSPVILKGIKRFARFTHKIVIKQDPFGELEAQKVQMLGNQKKFRTSKGRIASLKEEMEIAASEAEEKAKTFESRILKYHTDAKKLQIAMETLVKTKGDVIKREDEYVNKRIEYMRVVSDAERLRHELAQQKDFVQKYGARGVIMKKLNQKLALVEVSMDIKIKDFDATIEILKKDFEFAQKAKEATTAAKDAMLFTKSWELEYALDVVTTTIAHDISLTNGNLKDIDSITTNYAIDSDEMWTNLDLVSENIRTGKDPIMLSKEYENPDYELTSEDRKKSGGFTNMF